MSYRKQLQKLDELRKSNTQHSETKKRQIIEMVRDDVGSKIKGMVETDWKLQQMLLPADLANKVELYTEPLKSKSQQTYGSSKVHKNINLLDMSCDYVLIDRVFPEGVPPDHFPNPTAAAAPGMRQQRCPRWNWTKD